MHFRIAAALLILSAGAVAQTAPARAASSAELPVRRVVLYKNGVGYFEHLGRVRGDQDVSIPFTTSQINDALASLTAIDLNGGQISGIRYNSIAPLSQRLASLPIQLDENTTRQKFLDALRGARVEIREGGATFAGRLLSVEGGARIVDGKSIAILNVGVVSDAGELRSFEFGSAGSIRFTEPELNRQVAQYFEMIATSRAKDMRVMTLSDRGAGERTLLVSYISAAPVWKSTYRLILPTKAGDKPILQGWAIVDNTIGVDWKDVELSLVAGAPQSFIQNLAQPLNAERPTVEIRQVAQLAPTTHEGGYAAAGVSSSISGAVMDAEGAVIPNARVTLTSDSGYSTRAQSNGEGVFSARALPPGKYSVRYEASGFKPYEVSHLVVRPGDVVTMPSATLQMGGIMGQIVNVDASELTVDIKASGGGSSSKRKTRVSMGRGFGAGTGVSYSAAGLVSDGAHVIDPGCNCDAVGMVNADMVAERKVTSEFSVEAAQEALARQESQASGERLGDYFEYKLKNRITVLQNQSVLAPILSSPIEAEKVTLWTPGEAAPLLALWMKNTSGLTLDGGSFAIIDKQSFAGQGVFDEMRPDERRLISYAADTAVKVTHAFEQSARPVTRIRISKGSLFMTREEHRQTTYIARDSDSEARELVIEHPTQTGWTLDKDAPKPEETTSSALRFKLAIEPGKTAQIAVAETHSLETEYVLSSLSDAQIKFIAVQQKRSPKLDEAMKLLLAKNAEIDAVGSKIDANEEEQNKIGEAQERLRENLKALKGSAEEKELVRRYVGELTQQEDRLRTLSKEAEALDAQQKKLEAEQKAIIEKLSLDESL